MTVNEARLSQLINAARERGTFSIDELRDAFPITDMDAEDVSSLIARLEEAGISVEIDPRLFSPRHDSKRETLVVPKVRAPQDQTGGRGLGDSSATRSSGSARPVSQDLPNVDAARTEPSGVSVPGGYGNWLLALLVVVVIAGIAWFNTG